MWATSDFTMNKMSGRRTMLIDQKIHPISQYVVDQNPSACS